jgi:hypothetical protein
VQNSLCRIRLRKLLPTKHSNAHVLASKATFTVTVKSPTVGLGHTSVAVVYISTLAASILIAAWIRPWECVPYKVCFKASFEHVRNRINNEHRVVCVTGLT